MDLEYLLFLQGLRQDFGGEGLFSLISAIPSSPLTAAIPAVLFWCRSKRAAIFLLFNAICGRMINELLKGTFCVYRPWFKDAELIPAAEAMEKASSWSFPSGHTQFTTAIYGGLAFFYRKTAPQLIIPCAAIILLVAFSRNFLGVHTPQDVIFAIIYSVGLFFLAEKVFAWEKNDEERQFIVFIGGIAFCVIIFLFLYFKPYPEDLFNEKIIVDPLVARSNAFDALGFGLAFFLGRFLEQKFVNFKINVPQKDRLWRIIIGFAVLGVISAIFYPLMKNFLNLEAYKFFKAFLPFFSILFVIPLIFTHVEQHFKR